MSTSILEKKEVKMTLEEEMAEWKSKGKVKKIPAGYAWGWVPSETWRKTATPQFEPAGEVKKKVYKRDPSKQSEYWKKWRAKKQLQKEQQDVAI